MAGLRINDQKNAIAVTVIIVTAFKICIATGKNVFLNRPRINKLVFRNFY